MNGTLIGGMVTSLLVGSCVLGAADLLPQLKDGQESAWRAEWIGAASPADSGAQSNLWTGYRKSFMVTRKPGSAKARIAVDSKYWLWVNGQRVVREGGLKRGPNPQDTYFDEVDLAPYLVKGSNTVAVLAWYWGRDGFSHKSSGKAGLLFELEARGVTLLSDGTWKARIHPAFGQSKTIPNFRLSESRVRFDARLDIPDWSASGFDDQGWSAATGLGVPPVAPWNRLWKREIPQWKDYGLKEFVNAGELPSESTGAPIQGKMPYNAQVTPWFKVSAPAGVVIKVGTDNSANEIDAEYTTREGGQEFETPAWMNGHSVVFQIPKGVKILGLKYRESGFATELNGRFDCDQDFYNRLWIKSQRTLYVTMRDNFMDCPDRERAAWWGDIVVELGEVFYSLSLSAHGLIRKCMFNLADWQRPSKTLFSPIPAGNWNKELPQQMLASVGKYGFWNYYLNTGDAQTIVELYPHVRDYLSIWKTDEDGLLVHRSGENGWDWCDWGDHVDTRVLDSVWFCLALDGAARMAEVAGKPEEAAAFRQQWASIAEAVNRKFWNGTAYRDPKHNGPTDDRANGLAVVAGIAKPDQYAAIKAVLAAERHASPYMEKYVLESLFLMGDAPAALARMEERYRDSVVSSLTTLPELFRKGGTSNHAWSGGPLTLLSQYVAGIAPTAPGFETYDVRPQLGPLNKVSAGFDSVKGRIEVDIERGPKSFMLKLKSPAGTAARVCIPVAAYGLTSISVQGKRMWQDGKLIRSRSGVKSGEGVPGHACFTVAPGTWTFEAKE
jgi:hypothetical protein